VIETRHRAVREAGLVHLNGTTNLGELDLGATRLTNGGLEHLQGLANLRMLVLTSTPVTDEGVKEFERALPNCRVYH
jgi:hypothetical protein